MSIEIDFREEVTKEQANWLHPNFRDVRDVQDPEADEDGGSA